MSAVADGRLVRRLADGLIIADCPDERDIPDVVVALNAFPRLVSAAQACLLRDDIASDELGDCIRAAAALTAAGAQ